MSEKSLEQAKKLLNLFRQLDENEQLAASDMLRATPKALDDAKKLLTLFRQLDEDEQLAVSDMLRATEVLTRKRRNGAG